MDNSRKELLRKAVELHGAIAPPYSRNSLEECFTTEDTKLIFWFNDESGTTKVLVKDQAQL